MKNFFSFKTMHYFLCISFIFSLYEFSKHNYQFLLTELLFKIFLSVFLMYYLISIFSFKLYQFLNKQISLKKANIYNTDIFEKQNFYKFIILGFLLLIFLYIFSIQTYENLTKIYIHGFDTNNNFKFIFAIVNEKNFNYNFDLLFSILLLIFIVSLIFIGYLFLPLPGLIFINTSNIEIILKIYRISLNLKAKIKQFLIFIFKSIFNLYKLVQKEQIKIYNFVCIKILQLLKISKKGNVPPNFNNYLVN